MIDSSILRCHAPSVKAIKAGFQAGGAIVNAQASLSLQNATIEGCTSGAVASAVTAMPLASLNIHLLTITPPCADVSAISMASNATVLPLLALAAGAATIRGLTAASPEGCSAPDSAAYTAYLAARLFASPALAVPSCSAISPAVCGVAASCVALPVAEASNWTTPWCSCVPPRRPLDTAPSDALAPFTHGCSTPRRATQVQPAAVVASSVVVRLERTTLEQNETRLLLVSMTGTSGARALWEIGAGVPTWLAPAKLQGEIGSGAVDIFISVDLSTVGLPERANPYEGVLNLTVYGANDLVTAVSFQVPLYLFVSATIHTAAWGLPSASYACAPAAAGQQTVVVGETTSIHFSACDGAGLATAHPLPSFDDNRNVSVLILPARDDVTTRIVFTTDLS